ncbi:SEC-C metal-binding domain-containing protein [Uliginosibacterium flavum]
MNFFETSVLQQLKDHITYFAQSPHSAKLTKSKKDGRNNSCPCGSEKEYKKCHA